MDVMPFVCQQPPLERPRREDHEADCHRGLAQARHQPRQTSWMPIEEDQALPDVGRLEGEEPEEHPQQRVRKRPYEAEPDGHGGTVSRRVRLSAGVW